MKNLEENVDSVLIPTCDGVENIERAKTAIKFVEKNNLPKRYTILGLGPDTGIALGYEENPDNHKLDFHRDIYGYMMNETDGMIGIDLVSLNSIENILQAFPEGMRGKHAIVSYPLHLMRFKKIVKDAKKTGKISKDVEVKYVPTKQRMKWIGHEILSNIKYHLKGKKKYFGKSKIE